MENWRKRERAAKAFVWCCWLAMFPNAPYIITDFIHLYEIPPLTWWFDLGMILTFALSGLFLGIVSLRTMHDLVRPKLGAVIGWLFVAVASLLSGFGVYLGRFQRLNSWDLLTKPQRRLRRHPPRPQHPLRSTPRPLRRHPHVRRTHLRHLHHVRLNIPTARIRFSQRRDLNTEITEHTETRPRRGWKADERR